MPLLLAALTSAAPAALLLRAAVMGAERAHLVKKDIAGSSPVFRLRSQVAGPHVIGNQVAGLQVELFEKQHVFGLDLAA